MLVRDVGLLASAVARPPAVGFGDDACPTLVEKAATRSFLLLNDADLAYEIDEAERMLVYVAACRHDVHDLSVVLGRWIIWSPPAATSVDSQGATSDRPP